MTTPVLSIRELTPADIDPITDYWFAADRDFLQAMGADIDKLPTREQWKAMLAKQIGQDYPEKKSYCLIWLVDGEPVGHSNVNQISFGHEAHMHLHIWHANGRAKGYGAKLVKLGLPYFFENLQLQKIICEPYALNPAPNKTLAKVGFRFIREYITTPGFINFEQPVTRWEITREQWKVEN